MIPQTSITPTTPMGANLLPTGGATFRVWAPRATAVYLNGIFSGTPSTTQTNDLLLTKDANGYWSGFLSSAVEGDQYHYWITGTGSTGYKRDPYARELASKTDFPNTLCTLRSATTYPWHDAAFLTPAYSDMLIYQIHIGTYAISRPGIPSTFLDVIAKLPYLVALGINVLQPLPIDEAETDPSMGYDGADYFSPDFDYVVTDPTLLTQHLATINALLQAKTLPPLTLADIIPGPAQLKALVDLCHIHGIAVIFDVVYNHAGGFTVNGALDDNCLYYFDRTPNTGNNNDSLYFTDQDRGTGGLSFALWNSAVSQFLIDNATYYIQEFHADGFRYDEISDLLDMNRTSGWTFCQNITSTLRCLKPQLLQNAEFWPGEVPNYPASTQSIVTPTTAGGAGFDVVQHDGVRNALRTAVHSASAGQQATIDFTTLADTLYPAKFAHAWQTITCVENHDIVKIGTDQRIPTLADSSNPASWYARSRTRFAMGVLLTVPGLPQLFMGQEFLEPLQWNWDATSTNLLDWTDLNTGASQPMVDHLRFTQDLIRLRSNNPALRSDNLQVSYTSNADRVIAYHRWLDNGPDIVVVATLSETNWYNYAIGFPAPGQWSEIFNSDVYDNWVNPTVAGNAGGIVASGPPLHGFPTFAPITIPANGIIVFART
jgi:1,4-alpha-glucan branching enzyme